MTEVVKPTRRYDASRRQEQARENRGRILEVARRLFLEQGYAETAMPEIAAAASVSTQTVYKVFANKATLLKAVFDVSVAGDDEPIPMLERDLIGEIRAEPDAARKLTRYAAHLAEGAHRYVPVHLLVRAAAGADRAAADVWEQTRQESLTGMTYFAADLVATGQLHPGLSADEVRDILCTYHGPDLYELLVLERGWSAERYGQFVAASMIGALIHGLPESAL